MAKGRRLNKTEGTILGLIWLKNKLHIKTSRLEKLFNKDMYKIRKALNRLHEKRWIYKKNCGRNGLELSLREKEIPEYVVKIAVNNLLLALAVVYCSPAFLFRKRVAEMARYFPA